MRFVGKGKIVHGSEDSEGEDFTIEGPLSHFRASFEVVGNLQESNGKKKIDFKSIDV